jgi:PAS domain S-box-containing protein
MTHPDGSIFWYNQRWYDYTGATPEKMEGWGWQSVHDPNRLPTVMERWMVSIQTGKPFEMIFPLRAANGVFRSFLTRVVPIKNSKGAIVRWFGTNTDVEELRRTQEALRESESRLRLSQERLQLVQRAAKIAAWELDLDNDEYIWSAEVFEMFKRPTLGHREADLLSLMIYSADRENAIKAMKLAGTKKKEYEIEFRLVWPDGQVRLIAARGRFFYNQGQSLLLGVFIDVTEAARHHAADFPATKKIAKRTQG